MVGELDLDLTAPRRSISSSIVDSCAGGLGLEGSCWSAVVGSSEVVLGAVGVFAGEDLVGEMDLARSAMFKVSPVRVFSMFPASSRNGFS